MSIRLAVTMGDPAGVGPEVALKALRALAADGVSDLNVDLIGHPRSVLDAMRALGEVPADGLFVGDAVPGAPWATIRTPNYILGVHLDDALCGRPSAPAGRIAGESLILAAEWALAGEVDGIVTAPMHKQSIALAGYPFPGHTEWLAARAGTPGTMAFVGGGLFVGLVTIHAALREVPGLVTEEAVFAAGRAMAHAMDALAPRREPIGVMGLNPHASDDGRFGDEEAVAIAPAIARLNEAGIDAVGPLVPDVAFREHAGGRYGGLLAMYHDQALVAFKTLAFDDGVNVTLGLPFVRTSPDHGTAFDIAGTGKASETSMRAAIELAMELSASRARPLPSRSR